GGESRTSKFFSSKANPIRNRQQHQKTPNSMSEETNSNVAEAFDLSPVVEALIFAAEDSLSDRQIADSISETRGVAVAAADVARAVESLNAEYESSGRAFRIHVWSGGYRMATTGDFAPFVKTLYFQHRVTRLSRSLLETVAILAYKQPATKPEL